MTTRTRRHARRTGRGRIPPIGSDEPLRYDYDLPERLVGFHAPVRIRDGREGEYSIDDRAQRAALEPFEEIPRERIRGSSFFVD